MKFPRLSRWLLSLLIIAITSLAILGIQVSSQAKSPLSLDSASLSLEKVGDGIYSLVADVDFPPKNPQQAICNGIIIIGDDGVLVIDPFQSPELANLMLATVKELTDQPVRYVLNTHFHFDHTGGNSAIAAQKIPIIGRGDIRNLMLTKNTERDPNITPPTIILKENGSMWLGKREIRLEKAEGHTIGSDIVAYVPDAKVLITGDILFNERFPYINDGDLRQWQKTLDDLGDRYEEVTVIPGHGPITDSKGLANLKGYLDNLETLALSWKAKSLTQQQAIDNASDIPADYQDFKFQAFYGSNLQTAYQQITQSE